MPKRGNVTTISLSKEIKEKLAIYKTEKYSRDDLLEKILNLAEIELIK